MSTLLLNRHGPFSEEHLLELSKLLEDKVRS